MIKDVHERAQKRMQKSLEALQHTLAKIRTGRAHPSLIESLSVLYYGNATPLNQVANITVEDARTLSVVPWEKNMVGPVEKAIRSSDLGLNPMSAGQVIRVPLPPLTEERRKELLKHVKHDIEEGKVAIRNIRRDANTEIKDLLKQKSITEDEERRAQDGIQKLTDKSIQEADKILANKEAELLHV